MYYCVPLLPRKPNNAERDEERTECGDDTERCELGLSFFDDGLVSSQGAREVSPTPFELGSQLSKLRCGEESACDPVPLRWSMR